MSLIILRVFKITTCEKYGEVCIDKMPIKCVPVDEFSVFQKYLSCEKGKLQEQESVINVSPHAR